MTRGIALRGIGFAVATALGVVAVWLIVTSDSQKALKIGVLVGLWGLLIGAYALFGSRRAQQAPRPDKPRADDAGGELATRPSGLLEKAEDAAERRAWEQRLEQFLREEISSAMSRQVSSLRAEIAQLRHDLLEKVGGQLRLERIETTRLIGSDLEALQHEVRQLKVANEHGLLSDETGDKSRITEVRQVFGSSPRRHTAGDSVPAGGAGNVRHDVDDVVDAEVVDVEDGHPMAVPAQMAPPERAPADRTQSEPVQAAQRAPQRPVQVPAGQAPPVRQPPAAPQQPLAPQQPVRPPPAQKPFVQAPPARVPAAAQPPAHDRPVQVPSMDAPPRRTDDNGHSPAGPVPVIASASSASASAGSGAMTNGYSSGRSQPPQATTPLASSPPVSTPPASTPPVSAGVTPPVQAAPLAEATPLFEAARPVEATPLFEAARPEEAATVASRFDDPFASLPRIRPFTDFELDPIEPTPVPPANGSPADSATDEHPHDPSSADVDPSYTGRRRRAEELAAAKNASGRHSRPDARTDGGRRRRADDDASSADPRLNQPSRPSRH